MKKAFLFLVLLFVAVVAVTLLLPKDENRNAQAVTGLPWQVEIMPDGNSKVFGLTLNVSTIGDARKTFGPDMEIAIIAAPNEAGSLEAYYSRVTAGIISGKIIFTAGLDRETIERMRQRAPKSEYMESSTRKYALHQEDLAFAENSPITGITFIPQASLDADVALTRFGQPGERIRASEQVEHLLYPDKGLTLTLDSQGKEVLQYVAPRQFARLRDPLAAHAATK